MFKDDGVFCLLAYVRASRDRDGLENSGFFSMVPPRNNNSNNKMQHNQKKSMLVEIQKENWK